MDRGKEFADLAHRVLVSDGRDRLRAVADCMGVNYHVLYARLRNRTVFSADEIGRLIACVPDTRLVDYLLKDSPFLAAQRLTAAEDIEDATLWRATHQIVYDAIDVMRAIEKALRDNRIDAGEARAIREEIKAAERTLLALREHIRRISV